MLSALRTVDQKQVILLREDGLEMAEALRTQAREDRIVCEVCAQPVLVRAGMERTWHFAHRTREHCPKAQESMELIECRALLYGWLRVRFPDAVHLEKVLPGLPRPVDCWVDRPGKPPLAWWLVTAGLKPEVRGQLAHGFAEAGALTHYVFLAKMLTPDPDLNCGFILGTTERGLMRPSSYGELYGGLSQSLHYLDGATRRLTTCRGLIPAHPPQGFSAYLQEHPLEEVRILPSTGEFVHPGEAEGLKALLEAARQKEAQRQDALRAARQAEKDRAARLAAKAALVSKWEPLAPPPPQTTALSLAPVLPTPPPPAVIPIEPTYTCRICGCQTRDWVVRYGNTGQCKCRACSR
ncbi:MAG: hypothetical protein HGA66_04735 [Holophaga sp.]|nr:hypothetical protein [Holophaga sp.]